MRLAAYLILIASLLGLGGCASTNELQDPDRVSSMPWAKPEKWEGQGPMGSMFPGAGGGY